VYSIELWLYVEGVDRLATCPPLEHRHYRTEDHHQNGDQNYPTYEYSGRERALSDADVEPMPIRTTGHLWGSDIEFSPDGIRIVYATRVTRWTVRSSR